MKQRKHNIEPENIFLGHTCFTNYPLMKTALKMQRRTRTTYFQTCYSSHTDSMAVGEYQWAKIQVQKHLLVPSPQNPATQDENKTLI